MIGQREDTEPFQVLSSGDLDLLMWIGLKTQNPTCQNVARAMDEALLVKMSTKGAALWSLQSNAGQHGTVRLLCIEEAKKPGGALAAECGMTASPFFLTANGRE